jgi:hypothetical protein
VHDHADDKEDEEDEEDDLSDLGGNRGDPAETEHARHDGDGEEKQSPAQHRRSPDVVADRGDRPSSPQRDVAALVPDAKPLGITKSDIKGISDIVVSAAARCISASDRAGKP